jgi:hypothetical protein
MDGMDNEPLPLPTATIAGMGSWQGAGHGPDAEPILWIDTPAVSSKPGNMGGVKAAESSLDATCQSIYLIVAHHGNELNEFVGIQLVSTLRDHANYFNCQAAQEAHECHKGSVKLDGRTWRHAAYAQGIALGLWGPDTPFDQPPPLWVAKKAVDAMPWLRKDVLRITTAIAATGSSEGFQPSSASKPQTTVGISRSNSNLAVSADARKVMYCTAPTHPWQDWPGNACKWAGKIAYRCGRFTFRDKGLIPDVAHSPGTTKKTPAMFSTCNGWMHMTGAPTGVLPTSTKEFCGSATTPSPWQPFKA